MPIDWQVARALWGFGLGALFILMIYLIQKDGWFRKATGDSAPETDLRPKPEGTVEDFPEGIEEGGARNTVFVKVYIVAFIIFAIGYVTLFLLARNGMIVLPPLTASPYAPPPGY
jgi:hypothetical protein